MTLSGLEPPSHPHNELIWEYAACCTIGSKVGRHSTKKHD